MTPCSLDDLFILAEATPFLEALDKSIREKETGRLPRQWATQDSIEKLLQDTGVQIDREMNGYDANEQAPGPQSACLNAAYQPVDQERINSVLKNAYACLDDGEKSQARQKLSEIMSALHVSLPLQPTTAKPAHKPNMRP